MREDRHDEARNDFLVATQGLFHGGGSLTGSIAEVHWYPEHSVATTLLYNVFPRVPGVSDAIPRVVFGVPLPGKAPQATPANPAPAPATTMPAEPTKLAGVYALTAQRTFEVTLENGELSITPPGGSLGNLFARCAYCGYVDTHMRSASFTAIFVLQALALERRGWLTPSPAIARCRSCFRSGGARSNA